MLSQKSDTQLLNDASTATVPESSAEPAAAPCSVASPSTITTAVTVTTTGVTTPAPALSDARIVRFNNRDLEKIQDELNALKAGGALARGSASPIVIKAELTSPHKVVAQSGGMTQTPVAARQQVVVVQKPPPTNNVLASPKKVSDVRVIHPPGLARKIITPTTGTATAGGQVITKVIINPSGASHLVNTAGGTAVQLVGTGVPGQPTLVLSSPTRHPAGTTLRTGQQVVRVAGPAGLSPTKSMYVVSPVKTGGKVTMIPVSMTKSPQRIAPAPVSSMAALAGSHRVVLVTAGMATTTATGSTVTKAPSGTLLQVPKMNVVLRPATSQVVASASQGASSVSTGTTATGAVQVPGSKFHYVRLVSAPTQTASQSGTSATGGKVSTLIPVTAARALAPAASSSSASASAVTSPVAGVTPVRVAVPIAPTSSTQQQVLGSTTTTTTPTAQRVLIPASSVASMSQVRTATSLSTLAPGTVLSTGGSGGVQSAFVVVPAQYVAQFQGGTQSMGGSGTGGNIAARVVLQPSSSLLGASAGSGASPAAGATSGFVPIAAAVPLSSASSSVGNSSQLLLDHHQHNEATQHHASHHQPQHRGQQVNGTPSEDNSRPRKPCNCTKSQCLKLYCDCFANGEFCNSCNCNNCFNNLEHEEERQKAITACLDRNPNAFRPKIGKGKEGDHERRHTKGCNCKKSGCLKNYCECYEAKILCTNICKCVGCKNFEDSSERKTLMQLADAAEVRVQQQAAARTKISAHDLPTRPPTVSDTGERLPFTFITPEVVEATCQCLLARSENGKKLGLRAVEVERSILEEFGRCLLAIIDSANKTKGTRCSD